MATQPASTMDLPPGQTRTRIPLRLISALLAVVYIAITSYMTWTKIANVPLECNNEGFINCAVVENSAWAYILGIPTSAWGLAAHLTIAAVLLMESRIAFFQRYGVYFIFGIALFSVMYHAYLVYISINVLRALCPWYLAAATTMTLQLITTSFRLRSALSTPQG